MLTCVNRIVLERVLTWLSELHAAPPPRHHATSKHSHTPAPADTTEYADEFDDCQYCIHISRPAAASDAGPPALPQFVLSLSVVALAEEASAGPPHLQREAACKLMTDAFKGVARVVDPPAGFQISLALDGKTLKHMSRSDQQYWATNVASIRQLVTGGPLRKHFACLSRGEPACGPLECHPTRQGSVYFIHPSGDSVDVVYPMSFGDAQDAAIGVAMLQEFQTARQRTSLALSPSCSYSKAPPAMVGAVSPRLLAGVNGGWLVLTVRARHVSGPQLEHVLWQLCTLQAMVGLAVRRCKAVLRAQMRRNADALVELMEAARGTLGAVGAGGTERVGGTIASVATEGTSGSADEDGAAAGAVVVDAAATTSSASPAAAGAVDKLEILAVDARKAGEPPKGLDDTARILDQSER